MPRSIYIRPYLAHVRRSYVFHTYVAKLRIYIYAHTVWHIPTHTTTTTTTKSCRCVALVMLGQVAQCFVPVLGLCQGCGHHMDAWLELYNNVASGRGGLGLLHPYCRGMTTALESHSRHKVQPPASPVVSLNTCIQHTAHVSADVSLVPLRPTVLRVLLSPACACPCLPLFLPCLCSQELQLSRSVAAKAGYPRQVCVYVSGCQGC